MVYYHRPVSYTHLDVYKRQVLTGVKPSNILTLKNVSAKEVAESLKELGISYSMLCDSGVRKVWLIYREEEILEILGKKEYSEFLDTLGYRGFEFPQMLQIMNLRFEGYQHGSAEFPHELGIFLGYPLADVKGFIEHNGKDFLYQGYWKVYENVEERKKMFSIYNLSLIHIYQICCDKGRNCIGRTGERKTGRRHREM